MSAIIDRFAELEAQVTNTVARAELEQLRPVYEQEVAALRQQAEARRHADEAAQNQRTALEALNWLEIQLDADEQRALAHFVERRAELAKQRRRITGDVLPGDIPGPKPDDVAFVVIPAGVYDGREQPERQLCMTVREARAKGYAPRNGWQ